MCTVVTLRRPGHEWPLLLAANRDEMVGRIWSPPARHWPERPGAVAGLDHEAGGSWLGINDRGLVAAVLNRRASLGAAADKRSRGELVLMALDCGSADEAVERLSVLDAGDYRGFNMAVCDAGEGYWLRGLGAGGVETKALPEGVGMLTAWDCNDVGNSPRTALYLPRFRAAEAPRVEAGDWRAWEALLASTETIPGVIDPNGAMTVKTDWGFGTVSRSLIALPAGGAKGIWRFQRLYPQECPFEVISA